jgi:hypothetical protein
MRRMIASCQELCEKREQFCVAPETRSVPRNDREGLIIDMQRQFSISSF